MEWCSLFENVISCAPKPKKEHPYNDFEPDLANNDVKVFAFQTEKMNTLTTISSPTMPKMM